MSAAAADKKIDPPAGLPVDLRDRIAAEPALPPAEVRQHLDYLRQWREEANALRVNVDDAVRHAERLQRELEAARAELAEKTATLRAIDREASKDRIDRLVTEGREAERRAVAGDLTAARAEIARLRSENDDLRASKKKLREALDRARGGGH